ncbi:hypothetical protein [Streptomyces leeuwenhoekii]|uniref:hypothetical protein n=1 Tax=Streptomyces leeuwenhoekii TaxID=1437453 RepID=UPI000A402024|nr:hypothetical protein [Streptomyces leeuwenhoekii]
MPNVMSADQTRPTLPRRLIAAGFIRRTPGRTTTVRVTAAGVTGVIAKAVAQ